MSAKETVKILLIKRARTVKWLAQELSQALGREISYQSLSKKISRDTLRFCEMEHIAKILNYDISFNDVNK